MKMNGLLRGALRTAVLWLAACGVALAQNSIEAVDVSQQGGKVVLRITTKDPLQTPPPIPREPEAAAGSFTPACSVASWL